MAYKTIAFTQKEKSQTSSKRKYKSTNAKQLIERVLQTCKKARVEEANQLNIIRTQKLDALGFLWNNYNEGVFNSVDKMTLHVLKIQCNTLFPDLTEVTTSIDKLIKFTT